MDLDAADKEVESYMDFGFSNTSSNSSKWFTMKHDSHRHLLHGLYKHTFVVDYLLRLSPPITKYDFSFSLSGTEGLCDLFDIPC